MEDHLKHFQADLTVSDEWDQKFDQWQEGCDVDLSAFLADFLENIAIKFIEIN